MHVDEPDISGGNTTGREERRLFTLIHVFAALGVGGVVVAIVLAGRSVDDTEHAAEVARRQRRDLELIAAGLHHVNAQFEGCRHALFVGPEAPPRIPDTDAVQGLLARRSGLPSAVRTKINALVRDIDETRDAVVAGNAWYEEHGRMLRTRQLAQSHVESVLAELLALIRDIEKRTLADRRRSYERIGGLVPVDRTEALNTLMNGVAGEAALPQLRDIAHELARLVVVIAEGDSRRRLLKVRDLQMARSLERLNEVLAGLVLDRREADVGRLRLLAGRLRIGFLGTPEVSEVPEQAGMIASHLAWLAHREVGDAMSETLASSIDRIRHARGRLHNLLDAAIMAEAGSLQGRSRTRWWILATLASVVAPLMILLGVVIGRSARRRTVDLSNAERDAASAVRAQGLFLANMSHEIRTPMNGVLGMAELLEASPLTDEQKQITRTIRSSSEALLTVINDILDFSKIQEGKLELDPADFDLRNTVADSLDLLRHIARAKNVDLVSSIEHGVPRLLRGDAGRLRQVLLNLTGNAIKFTPEGRVTVLVERVHEHRGQVRLQISVSDTGVGIPEDVQARLFRQFTQADAGTTRRYGGTGLGLVISKRLVQLMGGEVHVRSAPGLGSTFSFTANLQRPVEEKQVDAPADLSGRAVLLVMPEGPQREELTELLAIWRMGFDAVDSTEMALRVLRAAQRRQLPFDAVLIVPESARDATLDLIDEIAADGNIAAVRSLVIATPDRAEEIDASVDVPVLSAPSQGELHRAVQSIVGLDPSGDGSGARSAAIPAEGLGLHVLVAEDNTINQRVFERMLDKLGCTFRTVENGRAAVEAVQIARYDLVLMDCQMPEMDGFDATRTIRDLPGPEQELPIVALTANVLPADRKACLEAGMNDFLPKPLKKRQLFETLERWKRALAEGKTGAVTRLLEPGEPESAE